MNLAAFVAERFGALWNRNVFRATVTGTSGNKVFIRRTGQADPDGQAYPRLVSYTSPTADDEVLCMSVGGSVIVVGEVIR